MHSKPVSLLRRRATAASRLACAVGGLVVGVVVAVWAAPPFESATVSVVHNQVSIGKGAGEGGRPAKVSDVIGARDYLMTAADSRAELLFADRSLVRVGQNSVFSFEAASRNLSLKKGSMIFYVPPGNGGQISTPSLSAAITGTLGKMAAEDVREVIAILRGSAKSKWGNIPAGWAVESVNGQINIFRFDPTGATAGRLYRLANKPLPEDPADLEIEEVQQFTLPDLHQFDVQDITQTNQNVQGAANNQQPEPTPTPMPTPHEMVISGSY